MTPNQAHNIVQLRSYVCTTLNQKDAEMKNQHIWTSIHLFDTSQVSQIIDTELSTNPYNRANISQIFAVSTAYLPKRKESANDLVYSAVGEGKQIKEYIYASKMCQFCHRGIHN